MTDGHGDRKGRGAGRVPDDASRRREWLDLAVIASGIAVLVLVLLRNAQTDTETTAQPDYEHEPAVPYPRPEES